MKSVLVNFASILSALACALALPTGMAAQQVTLPVDTSVLPEGVEGVDIILLLGQSNMRGRGIVPTQQTPNPRILNMNLEDRQWYVAQHPLHKSGTPDLIDGSDNSGVGPGLDFANHVLATQPARMIALVPAARGGSWVNLWQPGRDLYVEAIDRARKALADFPPGSARIRAVLWLQGESDAQDNRYADYQTRLTNVINGLRADLDLPDLPFLACTIGSFIRPEQFNRVAEINADLLSLPERTPHSACVDARDLTGHIGDFLHYDTHTQQIIGQRYAAAYRQLLAQQDGYRDLLPYFGEWQSVDGRIHQSRDFGDIEILSLNWMHHSSLGWLYAEPALIPGWLYANDGSWFYVDATLLPWYYSVTSGWLYWRPNGG